MAAIFDALANMAATAVGTAAGFQIALRVQQNLQPHPLPRQFAPLLEHPLRLEYLDPPQMLDAFGVGVSMIVLDLGCGTGLFTRTAAHMVGVDGRIHAVDLQAAMLAETRQRVEFEAVLDRVSLHHTGAYVLPLPDDGIDVAFIISTLGEIPDKPAALNEVRRVLKPGARLGIADELLNPAFMRLGAVRRCAEESGFQPLHSTHTLTGYHAAFINDK
ncbi:MAG: methyltransferase domain-containing protein [Caldilinea sp.]|uniref:class I SAM-dependent methyltransferase n=1 Tax=Caldilinea sp. TaxID=2293560 RepID=UPI002BD0E906|nr:methyltransferase domain-containing protein [Caldilinea sp.]